MNRAKYLVKNVGLLAISNFSSKILVFLLVPLYTNALSTTEYGTYDLIISTVGLLYPVLTLNIVDAVMRFTMDRAYSKKKVISLGIKYIYISVIMIVLISYGLHLMKIWDGLLVFFVLYYISYVFNQFFIQLAKGLDRIQDMAVAGVISTLTTLVFNVLFLLVFKCGLNGFFVANILSQTISLLYFWVRIRVWQYIGFERQDYTLKKEMLLYCIPLIVTTLGWWINNTLDKYAVIFICGVASNGLLSVSYKIPSILNTVQSIFMQAWQILAIKEYGEKDTSEFYGDIFSFVNLLMCVACATLILLTKTLAMLLYAKDFYVAWEYVPFLLISSVFNCASGLLGPVLSAKKDTKIMMLSAVIGIGVNIVLNIGLIYLIGIQGATIATAISSLAIYIVRRYGVGKDIVIENKYYLTWILLVIQASIEVTIESWIIELILCSVMVVVNYKNIVNIAKTVKNAMGK